MISLHYSMTKIIIMNGYINYFLNYLQTEKDATLLKVHYS